MTVFPEDVERWFMYHKASPRAAASMQKVRDAAKALAYTILENTPTSTDQATAFRLLRQSVAMANVSVVLNEQLP